MVATHEMTSGFDPGDDEVVVEKLRKWDGGPLSTALFTEMARILPQPTVEVVVLREHEGRIEALLLPRPPGDPIWPGMVHIPGSALRGADYRRSDGVVLNGPFERVRKEIGNDFVAQPEFSSVSSHMTNRGPESVQVYIAQIPDDAVLPEGRFWHPVDDLPNLGNFIMHQYPFIEKAAAHFAQRINPGIGQ